MVGISWEIWGNNYHVLHLCEFDTDSKAAEESAEIEDLEEAVTPYRTSNPHENCADGEK